jgi:hypothetical protein
MSIVWVSADVTIHVHKKPPIKITAKSGRFADLRGFAN